MHIAMGRYMLAADLAREAGATADIDLVTRRGLSRMLIEWDGGHALWASSPATFDEARAVGVDHLYDPEWTRLFDVKDPTDGPYPY